MASWTLCGLILICLISILMCEAESGRGRGSRGGGLLSRRGNHVTVVEDDGSQEVNTGSNEVRERPLRTRGRGIRRGGRRGSNRGGRRGDRRGRRRQNNRRPNCRRGRNCGGRHGGAPTEEDRQVLMRGLANSINNFSISLFKEMDNSMENFVFSPYSVYSALTMAMLGAKGLTKTEIRNSLHINLGRQRQVHQAMNIYNATIARRDDMTSLSTANAMYVKHGFISRIKRSYTHRLRDFYNSAIQEFLLVNPEEPINQWVEERTGGEIEDFLGEGTITDATLMMLINAVVFSGRWENPFTEYATFSDIFYVSDTETVDVQMMTKTQMFKIFNSDALGARVLDLPYAGGHYSMFILLPNEGVSLEEMEQRLTFGTMNEVLQLDNFERRAVAVKIPKFSMANDVTLNDKLRQIGINSAFECDANFKGMLINVARGRNCISISEVAHGATLTVNETGTVATAVTSVRIYPASSLRYLNVEPFSANKPFMFIIRDTSVGINLFMGRVSDPDGENI